MRTMRLQLGTIALAALSACLCAFTVRAQNPNRPPQQQSQPHSAPPRNASPPRTAPSSPHPQSSNPNRAPSNGNYAPPNPGSNRQSQSHPNPPSNFNNGNRPPQSHPNPPSNFNNRNRPPANEGSRQQPGAGGARPWVDTMRSLSPQQRERVLQN